MKKLILSIVLLLSTICSNAQTNYNNGFQDGYKQGYCYGQIVGCVSPVPPVSPIPLAGEDGNNYQQGYNRGFLAGKQYKQSTTTDNSYSGSGYSSSTPDRAGMLTGLADQQAQYQEQQTTTDNETDDNSEWLNNLDLASKMIDYYNDRINFIENNSSMNKNDSAAVDLLTNAVNNINKLEDTQKFKDIHQWKTTRLLLNDLAYVMKQYFANYTPSTKVDYSSFK
jgi:hypothetical protein